ncbi:MAG: hypothetical protein R2838_23895 [Caldilineaceae bacterium]
MLDTIPGVDQQVAEIIVAELGTDMTFPHSSPCGCLGRGGAGTQ